jgi:N-acetylglutamate synthase
MTERAPLVTAARLDDLANRAWPALETWRVGGWLVRASHGVTRRANSVLPMDDVDDLARAIDEVEEAYLSRGLRPTFQISPASQPRSLVSHLARRGYHEEAETLILVAPTEHVIEACGRGEHPASRVSVHEQPSDEWMSLWWDVDGRGGDTELDVARKILLGSTSRYAQATPGLSIADPAGGGAVEPCAVGRLALVDDWGGLFGIATSPRHRRRGHARRVVGALAREAARAGAACLWLQVLADNENAIGLYRRLGFVPISGYTYWLAPAVGRRV